jgi:hypothetical protein
MFIDENRLKLYGGGCDKKLLLVKIRGMDGPSLKGAPVLARAFSLFFFQFCEVDDDLVIIHK